MGYDHVIIAAPIHTSGITILSSPASFDPPVEYVHLHVTLLSTTSPNLNTTYFGLQKGSQTPGMLLTTWDAVRSGRGKGPEFNSISYHGLIQTGKEEKEWVVKVFSKEAKSDEWLSGILGDGKLGWVHRAEVSIMEKMHVVISTRDLDIVMSLISARSQRAWDRASPAVIVGNELSHSPLSVTDGARQKT